MNLHADIQARAAERARLDAATAAFLAAGKTIISLPGPGEHRAAGVNHTVATVYLPAGEQTQHMHRQRRSRQKALDKGSWENRQALINRYGERIKQAVEGGCSERGAAMFLRITRAQARMVAAAVGVTLPARARRVNAKAHPTFAQLADMMERGA